MKPHNEKIVMSGVRKLNSPGMMSGELANVFDVLMQLPITQEASVRGPNGDRNYDRKFNLVISGLSECAKGTEKQERVSHDITELVSALSEIDININGDSISDLYRLGKYNENRDRPRPVLVKFIRAADASKILTSKTKLSSPIYINKDLSKGERLLLSRLMKVRRKLIKSGVRRDKIRLKKLKFM